MLRAGLVPGKLFGVDVFVVYTYVGQEFAHGGDHGGGAAEVVGG